VTKWLTIKDFGPTGRKALPYHPQTIRKKSKDGTFPAPVELSLCRFVWLEEDIDS
jgi:hypothetical protein